MAAGDDSTVAQWQKREQKVFEKIESARAFYREFSEFNRKWSRRVSIVVMVCTALAPIFVVSVSEKGHFFGDHIDRYVAISITLILALAEGTKRIFRFEQRWATCYTANSALTSARDRYRIQRIGKEIGSQEWINNFHELRNTYENITDNESKQFFETLKLAGDASSTENKPSNTPPKQ